MVNELVSMMKRLETADIGAQYVNTRLFTRASIAGPAEQKALNTNFD